MWVGFSRVDTTAEAIAALMLASFTGAFSITVVDSILVTRTHGQSLDFAASLQSFCWGLQVSRQLSHCALVLDGSYTDTGVVMGGCPWIMPGSMLC